MKIMVLEKYKKQIIAEFFPANDIPQYPNYSNLKMALKNFKDISRDPNMIAELC